MIQGDLLVEAALLTMVGNNGTAIAHLRDDGRDVHDLGWIAEWASEYPRGRHLECRRCIETILH
jgi:hypothetical protein